LAVRSTRSSLQLDYEGILSELAEDRKRPETIGVAPGRANRRGIGSPAARAFVRRRRLRAHNACNRGGWANPAVGGKPYRKPVLCRRSRLCRLCPAISPGARITAI